MTNLYEKFKRLINKVDTIGFDEFYQAGTTSKHHELNLICRSKKLNRQYWITKSFGNFTVIYRNDLDNSKYEQYRIPCKNQTEVMKQLDLIKQKLELIN